MRFPCLPFIAAVPHSAFLIFTSANRLEIASICDEVKPVGKVSGLLRAVVSIGLPNLRATYSRDSMFNRKTDQRRAVEELLSFIDRETPCLKSWMGTTSTTVFNFVRAKYVTGYKSSNKRYTVTPDGKYRVAGAVGVGSKRPQAFEDRARQREKASHILGGQRTRHRAEQISTEYGVSAVDGEVNRLEALADKFVADELGAGSTYRRLDPQAFKSLLAAFKAKDTAHAERFHEVIKSLETFDKAREILRANAAPSDPWNAKAGNCGELAELASLRLERQHLPFICQASLSRRDGHVVDGHQGDHVFTIFGLRLNAHPDRFSRPNPPVLLEPKDRINLRSAWVIDPWVNVCCRIDEYPSRFWEKMKDWSGKGKRIAVGGQWIDPDPMSNSWYARTIFELDWEINEYRPYDCQVFAQEEQQQTMQQQLLRLW